MKSATCLKSWVRFLFLFLLYSKVMFAKADMSSEKEGLHAIQIQLDSLLSLSENLSSSDADTAVYFAAEALELELSHFSKSSAHTTKILADAYYYQHDFMEAIRYYQQSADILKVEKGEGVEDYAIRINDVGYCYYMMGYYEMAVTKYNEALQILRQSQNDEELYTTLLNIGAVYFKWGEYAKSLVFYEQTLKYDLELGDPYNLSVSYNNIGKVYDAAEKPAKAIDYFNLALEQAQLAVHPRMEATALSNLGMIYFDLKQFDKALLFVEEAMAIDQKTGNSLKVAIRKNELAKILAAKGELEKAVNYCQSALNFFESVKIQESQAIVLLDLGNFYKEMKEFSNSEESYLEGLEIAQQINSNYHAMLISKGLSDLYQAWGKTALALKFFKQYTAYNTEIFNAEKNRQLADFEIKYQTREKEIENQALKNENEAKQNRLILFYVASAGLLLLVVLLVFGIRFKAISNRQQKDLAALELRTKEKEKQHLEDKVFAEQHINQLQQQKHLSELEHKNQLLANSTLNLIQKNEFLVDLKNKMSNGYAQEESTNKKIIQLINQNIDIDQNWKKFSYEFDQTHPRFIDQLNTRYPDLSETYTQLCAFLRIDLSSKEIAQLQHVSISAVNKNRQRLRKKLGLEAEADLAEFLKELG